MVNRPSNASSPNLAVITALLRAYVLVVLATLLVLALLSVRAPGQAPQAAWVHTVIVAGFAVLLLVRARAARDGSVSALRAVGQISAVLLIVNVVEALIPGFVPTWMRVEMIAIAALMASVILTVVRERV